MCSFHGNCVCNPNHGRITDLTEKSQCCAFRMQLALFLILKLVWFSSGGLRSSTETWLVCLLVRSEWKFVTETTKPLFPLLFGEHDKRLQLPLGHVQSLLISFFYAQEIIKRQHGTIISPYIINFVNRQYLQRVV